MSHKVEGRASCPFSRAGTPGARPASARSTAAREYSIAELPTRLSPSLPALVLRPVHAHRKAGARAAVFFSPPIPSSVSAVREFLLRCPLLTPHHSLVYKYCKRRTVTGWGRGRLLKGCSIGPVKRGRIQVKSARLADEYRAV